MHSTCDPLYGSEFAAESSTCIGIPLIRTFRRGAWLFGLRLNRELSLQDGWMVFGKSVWRVFCWGKAGFLVLLGTRNE